MCTFAGDNSERSLAIQNNVPQSTSLISKSLPVYSAIEGNALILNKIVRKQKKLNASVCPEIGTFAKSSRATNKWEIL